MKLICFVHNMLLFSILTQLLLFSVTGLALGLVLKVYVPLTEIEQVYIAFPGELLMQMLQMVTIPLIMTSVVSGKLYVYFLCTFLYHEVLRIITLKKKYTATLAD